ncbi:SUMO1a protein [Mycena crocata]|nr:SUMO1a protein [Mycena crocata]
MTAASGEDVKPDVSKVRIVVEFNGKQLTFLHKKNKPLGKLLIAFCEKTNVERNKMRFNFDGNSVRDEATAEELEMDDGDVIDGHLYQEGGYLPDV